MTSAVHTALRERTQKIHDELERSVRIAAPGAGREDYARHIAALWGWMKSNEAALWRGDWPAAIDAPARAHKTSWLETDIAAARADGFIGEPIARSTALNLVSMPERFGAAYVIEGSMLGGAFLLGRLRERLAPWPLQYLHGYGALTGQYWRGYLASLTDHVISPAQIDEAAEAAQRTFADLALWFERAKA